MLGLVYDIILTNHFKIGDITFKNRKKVVQLNSISNIHEHNERKTNEKPFTKWQNITPKTHMIAIFLPRMLIKFRLNKEPANKKIYKKLTHRSMLLSGVHLRLF